MFNLQRKSILDRKRLKRFLRSSKRKALGKSARLGKVLVIEEKLVLLFPGPHPIDSRV